MSYRNDSDQPQYKTDQQELVKRGDAWDYAHLSQTQIKEEGKEKNKLERQHQMIMWNLKNRFNIQQESQVLKLVEEMFQQLELKYDINDKNDFYELANILCKYLRYPSTELARLHRNCNRLGQLDLHLTKRDSKDPHVFTCKCCRLSEQQQLSGLTRLDQMNNVGMSTHLFFLAIQALMILLLVMCLLFSSYSIYTNIHSSIKYGSSYSKEMLIDNKINSFNGVLATSLGSKILLKDEEANKNILIQCWLGALTILIWGFMFVLLKIKERKQYAQIKNAHPSPASFTLVFKNMPQKIETQQLQRNLQQYSQKSFEIKNIYVQQIAVVAPLFIDRSIFEDPKYLKWKQEAQKQKDVIRGWILQRKQSKKFSLSKVQRQEIIRKWSNYKSTANQHIDNRMSDYENQEISRIRSKDSIDYFVTFEKTQHKELIQRIHQTQQSYFFNLPCFGQKKYFTFQDSSRTYHPIIKPAPQPEDVKWKNLGETQFQRIRMWILTFLITVVLLCITFLIVFVLTAAQKSYTLNKPVDEQEKLVNFGISKGISIVIVVFNIVIGMVLNILTEKETHERESHEQISIGLKTILATLINTIVLPITVNFIVTANLFGVDGLADAVFSLAVSDTFLGSFLIWVNPSYWINIACFKWYSRPSKKLYLNQKYLNMINQRNKFAIGESYANVISKFLFTCFFAPLQPLIVPLALLGLLLIYLAEKYNLFKKYRRPILGTKQINDALFLVIYFGPLFYTLGSFLWTNLLPKTFIDSLPNIVALAISLLILITPIRLISRQLTKDSHYEGYFDFKDYLFRNNYRDMNPILKQQSMDEIHFLRGYVQSDQSLKFQYQPLFTKNIR